MAFFDCNCFSDVLGLSIQFHAVIPQKTEGQIGMAGEAGEGRHPTLWLLHGMSDDHTIWMRRTSVERYTADLGLAVIMPAVNRSYYTDMAEGLRYWTFVSEELPMLARQFFPLSAAREDNFVAGLSMGGYGAFKLALRCPQKFAAAASLSGLLDVASLLEDCEPEREAELRWTFGDPDKIRRSEHDLLYLLEKADKDALPKLYLSCGTEDFLYPQNQRFKALAEKLGIPLTCDEEPNDHNWSYWDAQIRKVLEWLPLRRER